MLTIPADIILQKNKLYSSEAFIELLEWQQSETGNTVRIANYNEDVSWNGNTWSKFWFEGGYERDSGGDSTDTITVRISAVDKAIQGRLESLTNGGIGDTVIYYRVHSGYLNLGAALSSSFEILNIDCGPNSEWVVFYLGAENFFLNQFPAHTFSRNVCRWSPSQTDICPYVNSTECNRSFNDCVWLNQEDVFGGQPGIPGGSFDISSVRGRTKTFVIDAKLDKTASSSTSLDSILYGKHRLAIDAIVVPDKFIEFDALLNKSQTAQSSLDALVQEVITKTLDIDAQISEIGKTAAVSIDGIVYGNLTVSIDAKFTKSQTLTTDIDALISRQSITKQLALDALLLLPQSTVVLDAKLQKEQSDNFNIDALLYGTSDLNLDALIQSIGNTASFDIDSILSKTGTSTFICDAKLNGEQTDTFKVDSLLYSIGSFYETAKLDAILYGEYVEDTSGLPIEDTTGDYIEDTTSG